MKLTTLGTLTAAILALPISLTLSGVTQAQNTSISNLNREENTTISGTIIGWGEADENEFILQDSTGTIVVDAGPRWSQDLNLNIGDTIAVTGEFDDGEFDAFSLTYADGTVVDIQYHDDEEQWENYDR
ncbi:MAG: DNA-binding protein [Roseofilum sp. SBFL]|uniref:hypothetical protein n=1 Tax=unclassified Roseofilum TaxID=2620099 RepID=UPI001B2EB8E9|nr:MULTISPECIES: hypothetical protein [unclassified Roseofilum]MBP0012528.1 DNA-binding protein [Roseofilum sp. SID3]MBP0024866.1 DNA-binding protein [Roseofilum sp. SID2]MBP0037563.1 DNA-binding protein [Roseofilum sp. SID1]MBP0041879.1 DNA-binding protein [Roseofilum sp. SBFL]